MSEESVTKAHFPDFGYPMHLILVRSYTMNLQVIVAPHILCLLDKISFRIIDHFGNSVENILGLKGSADVLVRYFSKQYPIASQKKN